MGRGAAGRLMVAGIYDKIIIMKMRFRHGIVVLAFAVFALSSSAERLAFVGTTDKDPISYKVWEKMTFTVTLVDRDAGNKPVKGRTLKWTLKGDDGTDESGEARSDEPFVKKAFQTKPGFVRLTVNVLDAAGKIVAGDEAKFDGGAGAGVTDIAASAIPSDFHRFWDARVAALLATPCAAKLTPVATTNDKVVVVKFLVPMGGKEAPAQGLLCHPKDAAARSLPIEVSVSGYGFGPTGLKPEKCLENGGKLALAITRQGEDPLMDKDYYENVKTNVCRNFCFRNNDRAENTDFYKMLMRDLKALQWAKSLPQWDGRRIATAGGSMGGYQALGLAALDPDVTSVWAFIPWCADISGHFLFKRMNGWVPAWTPALAYVQLANLATRVRCPVSMVIGLGDYVCPPSGEMILFRNLNCTKSLEIVQSMGHGARYGTDNASTRYTDFPVDRRFEVETMDYAHESVSKKPPRTGFRRIDGDEAWRGLVVYAPSRVAVPVGPKAKGVRFRPSVTDVETNHAHKCDGVKFAVFADGKRMWEKTIKHGDKRDFCTVDIPPSEKVEFVVEGPEGMELSWDELNFIYPAGSYPAHDVRNHSRQLGILTPREAPAPRINGARVFGVRPGHPILFRVPVTGAQPMSVAVTGLPEGAAFDPATRILSGRVAKAGDYALTFAASNRFGVAERKFTLKVGERIALTPAMGFNSWNAFAINVTQRQVESAADALVRLGLADHGWSYVVVDDFWQNKPGTRDKTLAGPERKADGTIQPNARFPDMKAMADRLHAYGLKAGLYSSPGPTTCGGCVGSWQHETQDAKTYAEWGFDFLKYDWCSYGNVATGDGRERAMKPYRVMGDALRAQDRDILFSLCQYGMDNVSEWGESVHGQSWRTTGDVFDMWTPIPGPLTSIPVSIDRQKNIWKHVHPGAWNDPDMLCVGRMKWNRYLGSRLAPNELYTHVSMWALVAAPLMIGCDMERMDDFTRGLLANDEVIEIDQDERGAAAACVAADEKAEWEVWARPLADGSIAAGLYNKGLKERKVRFDLVAAGLDGRWRVRDVWRQAETGETAAALEASVPGHATHLVRLWPLDEAARASAKRDVRLKAK